MIIIILTFLRVSHFAHLAQNVSNNVAGFSRYAGYLRLKYTNYKDVSVLCKVLQLKFKMIVYNIVTNITTQQCMLKSKQLILKKIAHLNAKL